MTIEIRDRAAFVHGGGREGRGRDTGRLERPARCCCPAASTARRQRLMIAKRGVGLTGCTLKARPYTGEQAKEGKVVALAQTPADHRPDVSEHNQRHRDPGNADAEVRRKALYPPAAPLYDAARRADRADHRRRRAGDEGGVGQVASQTMPALGVTDAAVEMPVFRPCIGLDKEEIIVRARQIGTADISALPTGTAAPSSLRATPTRGRCWRTFWKTSRASMSTPLRRAPTRDPPHAAAGGGR